MQIQDFAYDLPESLIAHYPSEKRSGSRLLCLDGPTGECRHQYFTDILSNLQPNDLLIFNNTKVIPARLYAHKLTGGHLEILVERICNNGEAIAHLRSSKSPKIGSDIVLENGNRVRIVGRENALFRLNFGQPVLKLLEAIGHIPLPPYIKRKDDVTDQTRYQTIYGTESGAVAAPTAGLHFDDSLLNALAAKKIETAFVTLHVGSGTFQPVRTDNIEEHAMHSEWMSLSREVCKKIKQTHALNGRVVAVGTTSVRALETAAMQTTTGEVNPYEGETSIFIYPGYEYRGVDALITNFHLPQSTLLMLVSAFAGYRHTMAAYRQAIAERYRFFSYGDAMFITRNPRAPEEIISSRQGS